MTISQPVPAISTGIRFWAGSSDSEAQSWQAVTVLRLHHPTVGPIQQVNFSHVSVVTCRAVQQPKCLQLTHWHKNLFFRNGYLVCGRQLKLSPKAMSAFWYSKKS